MNLHAGDALRCALQRALSKPPQNPILAHIGRPAAVLVPFFCDEQDGGARLWLLRRPLWMRAHGGQVAFPGGKLDPEDSGVTECALRETEEELGIPRASVTVMGQSDDYLTITGFRVTPVVGWVAPGVVPVPNPEEVARVFSVPFSTFLGRPTGTFPRVGLHHEQEFIWGATLAMARRLVDKLRRVGGIANQL